MATVFEAILCGIPLVIEKETDVVQTEPFLDVCRQVGGILEKFGMSFAIVKSDIDNNIKRLATAAAQDPPAHGDIFQIVRADVAAGTCTGTNSNTKGLLWLKRAMEFAVAILDNLNQNPEMTLYDAVTAAYGATLAPFHGWIAGGAFKVALACVPTREHFTQQLGDAEAVPGASKAFVEAFSPLLAKVHSFLSAEGQDYPDKV